MTICDAGSMCVPGYGTVILQYLHSEYEVEVEPAVARVRGTFGFKPSVCPIIIIIESSWRGHMA